SLVVDEEPGVREAAAVQLMHLARPGMNEIVEPLRKALSDRSPDVLRCALNALQQLATTATPAVPELIRLLTSGDKAEVDIRVKAAGALGTSEAQTPEVLAALTGAVRDEDPHVRTAAAQTLSRWSRLPVALTPVLLAYFDDALAGTSFYALG